LQKKFLVLFLAIALLVVSLSSVASTASASIPKVNPTANVYWSGTVALAQFQIPLRIEPDGDAFDENEIAAAQLLNGRELVITTVVAQPSDAKTAFLFAGICLQGECAVWIVQEISPLTYWGNFVFATAWVPIQLGSYFDYVKIELCWVKMNTAYSTDQVATLVNRGCTYLNIHGGSWTFASAFASVCLFNRCFDGCAFDALVATGNIDLNVNGYVLT